MKKGFTLIELLAVIVVLAIISVIAVPTIIGVIDKARLNALKDSAYGLIEASNLYYVHNQNSTNIRFDINNNNVSSSDTTKMLKYKGNIESGTSIIKSNGQTVICVTDGKNSAYKNYNETKVNLISKQVCTIPSNTSIVYLDGKATLDETSLADLMDEIQSLKNEIAELKANNNYATKEELSQVNTNLSSNILQVSSSLQSKMNISDAWIDNHIKSKVLNPSGNAQAINTDYKNGTSYMWVGNPKLDTLEFETKTASMDFQTIFDTVYSFRNFKGQFVTLTRNVTTDANGVFSMNVDGNHYHVLSAGSNLVIIHPFLSGTNWFGTAVDWAHPSQNIANKSLTVTIFCYKYA